MKNSIFENIIAGSYSLVLHIGLVALFVMGMNTQTRPVMVQPHVDIVKATVIDENSILAEMVRQQEVEQKQRKAEEDRQKKVDKQLAETEKELARKEQEVLAQQERAKIEQQQRELKAKEQKDKIHKLEQERKVQEQKRLKAEQARIVEEERQQQAEQASLVAEERKQKIEEERRAAEEKKRLAEADRKAEEQRKQDAEKARKLAEEKKRKAEADRKAAELRKVEEERKAQIAEADRLLQESLAQEQREQESRRIAGVVNQYAILIKQRIKRYWIRPTGKSDDLVTTVKVSLIPGGDVKSVIIVKSSGDQIFDRSVENAVFKAAPMPWPTDPEAAAQIKELQINFTATR
ncbi:protein TolA [Methylophaga sp. 42_25_T18]|mgnify:CR=1 FL=1|nr:protein TolA [Methylophaga sp. 42_25_T18]OUR86542.1 protein TolA [Methylophaga sp. 42_8_T64]